MSTGRNGAYYPVEAESWGPTTILLTHHPLPAQPPPRPHSDCGGSSSGLGGMNPSKVPLPPPPGSTFTPHAQGSDSEQSSEAGSSAETRRAKAASSKQSGTSSSGKGSSTGASPTSQPAATKTLSFAPTILPKHPLKEDGSTAGSHSSGPSTSSIPATTGHLSDGVSSNGTLKATFPPQPPPPQEFHPPPQPIHGCALEYGGVGVGMAGLNNPGPPPLIPPTGPPPFYTMTLAPLDAFHPPPSTSSRPASSYHSPAPPPNPPPPPPPPQHQPSSNPGGSGGPGGSRGSTSPPVGGGGGGGGLTTPGLPGYPPVPPNVGHHAVYVHVNLGETLSVRVGNDIQHIQGPATVRMVSGSLGPPVPLPLHVPPGHIVQQIVDQDGTLRHLILSPQHPPPLHPVVPTASFAASSSPQSGGVNATFTRTPPPGALDGAGHNDIHHHHLHHQTPLHAKANFRNRDGPHRPDSALPAEIRSNSGASNDDEDSDKIKVFLSRIRPPTIHDVGPREALVRWEALDCTEASAPGGPFPYIDSSEFTYEVLVTERSGHKRAPVTRSLVHKFVTGENEGSQQRLTDLRPSTEYTVKVRADLPDRGISGEPSHAVEFKTKPTQPDKPAAPFVAKKGKNFLNLAWKKPADNGAKITSYRMECDEGRGQWTSVYEGLDERARLNKLQPNSAYGLRLTAFNACGASEMSDTFLAHTSGAPPSQPRPPDLARAHPDSLTLSWTKRGGDERFSLQMEDPDSGHGFLPVSDTQEPTATVRGLAKAKEYAFRLLAENEDGKSVPSDEVTYRTSASRPGVPGKPYLKDRVKSSSLRLGWEPPRDSGGAEIAQYLLEYCAEEPANPKTWTTLYSGPHREYGVQALLPGTGYRFRVSCSGEGGGSSASEILSVSTTPLPPSPPGTPALVRAKPNSLQIRWQPPNNSGGAEVTEYEVVMGSPAKPNPMAPATVFQGLKQEVTLPNLLPGRTYNTKVRAVNRAGPGGWSNELSAETSAGAPDALVAPRLSSPPFPTCVRLEWDPPLLTNGAPVSEYRLFRSEEDPESEEDPFPDFAMVWSGNGCSAEVKGLRPATGYGFQLRAGNAAGLSTPSETLPVRTPPGPPDLPSNLQVEGTGQTSLGCSWEAPTDSGSPVLGYRVEVVDGPTVEVEETSATISNLLPETTYRLRVAAFNEIGQGAWSGITKASTFSRPPQPPVLELVGTSGHNLLKVKWTDVKPSPEPLHYQLDMENRSNTFSPIYEGALKSHKVPRLSESTGYRFRVRATSPTGGVGPWSEVYVFHTARSPPPPLKSTPKVTEVGEGMWQVEWVPIKASVLPKGDKLQYLLELQENGEWIKKYQGTSNSYTLSGLRGWEYRVRVSPVRLSRIGEREEPTEETTGPPTPTQSFAAHTKRERPEESAKENSVSGGTEAEEVETVGERRLSDSQWALVILVGFSLFAILIAYLIQALIAA